MGPGFLSHLHLARACAWGGRCPMSFVSRVSRSDRTGPRGLRLDARSAQVKGQDPKGRVLNLESEQAGVDFGGLRRSVVLEAAAIFVACHETRNTPKTKNTRPHVWLFCGGVVTSGQPYFSSSTRSTLDARRSTLNA